MKVTFLSNGHGEDAIAVFLAKEFLRQDASLSLQAYPIVNEGRAYQSLSMPILGGRQLMPSGGLTMHTRENFVKDIQAGFISKTFGQIKDLWKLETDVLVVVGDVYALGLSSLVKTKHRFYVQSLVSSRHASNVVQPNRYFMEHISYPERALMRHLVHHAYMRDDITAQQLHHLGLNRVSYLGNPMLDALEGKAMIGHSKPEIALLPGTREYATDSLKVMLEALKLLPGLTGLVAWSGDELPDLPEWQVAADYSYGPALRLTFRESTVYVYEGRFADILHSADIVLGTSGTANEQAAALGKPVVAFPVPPIYSKAFLDNQKRLLGESLYLSQAQPEQIAEIVKDLLGNAQKYELAARVGPQRMGKPGGRAMVEDMLSRIYIHRY
jgi:uncharacterized protein (TIGR03492 family)